MTLLFLPPFLLLFPLLCIATATTTNPEWYYLKSPSTGMYLSSSITYNGHINYVLLTDRSLAQPLSLFPGDGSITVNSSNVIGASAQAPLYLSDTVGFSDLYKQVLLGDDMAGKSTSGFSFAGDGKLGLAKEGFHGFFACAAARGVKQLYWADREREAVVSCERVEFVKEDSL